MTNIKFGIFIFTSFFFLGIPAANSFDFDVTDNAPAGNCTTMCTNPAPGTPCLIQNALDIAACNNENDTLNIAAGNYDASGGAFTYLAGNNENFSLTLIGDAGGGTILDAGNNNGVMEIDTNSAVPDADADIIVRQITFQNGSNDTGLQIDTDDGDITVENSQFLNNNSSSDGGGLEADTNGGDVFLSSNLLLDNTTDDGAGGGFLAHTSDGLITVVNNILAGNEVIDGGDGGGAFVNNDSASVVITNNTLFDNSTVDNGGGLAVQLDNSPNTIDIYNNIAWQNNALGNGDDIYTCEQGAVVNLFNNDFIDFFSESVDGGGCGAPTTINQNGNINDDPLFVNSGADDFHLTAPSPAIDTGDPAAPAMPSTDFDGNPRPAVPGTNPDIGALEFQPTPTPTPTPSPSPSPTPPAGDFLEGSGCSFQGEAGKNPVKGWLGLVALVGSLGILVRIRQSHFGRR